MQRYIITCFHVGMLARTYETTVKTVERHLKKMDRPACNKKPFRHKQNKGNQTSVEVLFLTFLRCEIQLQMCDK
jgi:hypothetical protein